MPPPGVPPGGDPAPGRVVVLTGTHRVAPGLLSWPAWDALRSADRVVTTDPRHAQRSAIEAAGVEVTVRDDVPAGRLAAVLTGLPGISVVLADAQSGDELARALAEALVLPAATGASPQVEVLVGSWDLPGSRLLDLVAVMDRLRSPGGCPWDAKQTHASLVEYLVEESYETVEAIETGDLAGLQEELGDLLLQVVFHARIGEEHAEAPWSVDDVAGGVVDKLVRRHPHVFGPDPGTGTPLTPEHLDASWETLKAAEKQRTSSLDGVPLALPALTLAAKLVSRSGRAGAGVEVPAPPVPDDVVASPEALGEVLLALTAAAAGRGVDPEAALRAASRRYADRVRHAERARART